MKVMGFTIAAWICVLTCLTPANCQTDLLVSAFGEFKANGNQPYFLINRKCYMTYRSDSSEFQLFINVGSFLMSELIPSPPGEVNFDQIQQDTSFLTFTGKVEPETIRPSKIINDTYTFTIKGIAVYKGHSYPVILYCQQGKVMRQSLTAISIDLDMDLLKMDQPIYIPAVKDFVDNLNCKFHDGFVNRLE